MSGVFGFADSNQSIDIHRLAKTMSTALTHHAWDVVRSFVDDDECFVIGQAGIGILNKGPQPVWNASSTVALVMAGEIYNRDELIDAGSPNSDEVIALALYEELGDDFVSRLEGAFVIAIWDKRRRQLLLTNDRFGLYPTYFAQTGSRFLFAPEIKGILADEKVSRSLRDDAVAEYFRFQRLLGSKTFFSAISLLPPATILTYTPGNATHQLRSYWDLSHAPTVPESIRFEEAVSEGARLLRIAVAKMSRGAERIGVFLSGGLDGRSILGMIPRDAREIHTFNFGQPGCRDEYYARKIAEAAGTKHHYYPYENGQWIRELVDFHLEMTEGFQPWIHMHGMNMLSTVRQYVDVNLSGLGDLLWLQPNFVPRHLVNAPDDIAFNSLLFELYSQRYSWPSITYAEERYLYNEKYYRRIDGLAFESFIKELKPYEKLPYAQRVAAFNLNNQFTRHLLYSGVAGRSHIEFRFPYSDLSLMSFCYGLPYEIGNSRRLQRAIIEREIPALARVPYEDDELPITNSNSIRAVYHLKNRLKRILRLTILPIFPYRPSLYADYELWLRTDLRQWAEGILFDERTLSRGIFRPEALRSLMDRTISAQQTALIGKIAPIITFEMMVRRYVD